MSVSTLVRGGLFGASAGVGALTIVNNPDGLTGVAHNIGQFALNGIARPGNYGAANGQQMDLVLQPLSQQVLDLSNEVAKLRVQSSLQVIHSGANGISWVSIATVGGVGTVVMYYMGYSFNDIMYVTKKALSDAVESLEEGLEQVGTALENAKRELSYKIGILEEKIEESRVSLEEKLSAEVGEVKRELAGVGDDVKIVASTQHEVRGLVEDLETQMKSLGHKMEHSSTQLSRANHGIHLLCNVVAENMVEGTEKKSSNNKISSLYEELMAFTESAISQMPSTPFSAFSRGNSAGLKDLVASEESSSSKN